MFIIQIVLLLALIVGSVLHFGQMGYKKCATYWSVFVGIAFLGGILPGSIIFLVQMMTVAVFFAHAKLANV